MANFHTYKTKVYYEDTDAGGIVYYAKYLHFIERARTEMIYDCLKLNHKKLKDVVRECNVKYHKSANFEDNLDVCTHIFKKTPVRLNLIQEVKREKEILVTAKVELAVVDSNGSINKLPKNLLEKI
jgi:acyl-CoA thioester hydrolase